MNACNREVFAMTAVIYSAFLLAVAREEFLGPHSDFSKPRQGAASGRCSEYSPGGQALAWCCLRSLVLSSGSGGSRRGCLQRMVRTGGRGNLWDTAVTYSTTIQAIPSHKKKQVQHFFSKTKIFDRFDRDVMHLLFILIVSRLFLKLR